jgi:hypothetical protein
MYQIGYPKSWIKSILRGNEPPVIPGSDPESRRRRWRREAAPAPFLHKRLRHNTLQRFPSFVSVPPPQPPAWHFPFFTPLSCVDTKTAKYRTDSSIFPIQLPHFHFFPSVTTTADCHGFGHGWRGIHRAIIRDRNPNFSIDFEHKI